MPALNLLTGQQDHRICAATRATPEGPSVSSRFPPVCRASVIFDQEWAGAQRLYHGEQLSIFQTSIAGPTCFCRLRDDQHGAVVCDSVPHPEPPRPGQAAGRGGCLPLEGRQGCAPSRPAPLAVLTSHRLHSQNPACSAMRCILSRSAAGGLAYPSDHPFLLCTTACTYTAKICIYEFSPCWPF